MTSTIVKYYLTLIVFYYISYCQQALAIVHVKDNLVFLPPHLCRGMHVNINKVLHKQDLIYLFTSFHLSDDELTCQHDEICNTDTFRRPIEPPMTMLDIEEYFVPAPIGITSGFNDYRLAIQRPHFSEHNTLDDLLVPLSKYNERSVQKVIIKNAQRLQIKIDINDVNATTAQAQSLGLEGLLRHKLDQRRHRMVQPINVATMVPPPTLRSEVSQPPYPTNAALMAMETVHLGIGLHIDPNALIDVGTASNDIGFNAAVERAVKISMDKGTMVTLRKDVFDNLCVEESLRKHYNKKFFVAKERGAIDDAGRLIIDFTASGINSLYSQQFYANRDGPYRDMTAAFIAQLCIDLRAKHPHEPIYLCVADVDDCFKRIPMDPRDIPMTAIEFSKDGQQLVALSIGANFGLNASNSTQKSLSEAINACCIRIDQEDNCPIGGIYVDDMISPRLYHQILQFFRTRHAVCDQFEGEDAISTRKSKFGEVITGLGYLFDTINMTISISDTLLEKYLWVIFHLLPPTLRRGHHITLRHAQIATSYLHLVVTVVPPLAAFSKALSRATRGVLQKGNSSVFIDTDTMIDLQFHREFALILFRDCRCLALPMHILPLRTLQVDETDEELQFRQQLAANFTLYSDARGISNTEWGDCWLIAPQGNTIATQDDIIIDFGFATWAALYEPPSITADTDLNIAILEMLTTLRGAYAFLHGARAPIRATNQILHIHILTDNHVSYYRLLKSKGTHPIVPYLLRMHSLLQQEQHVMFTYGTITSKDNKFTDAGSRNWMTEYGPCALRKINGLLPTTMLPPWWTDLPEILRSIPEQRSHRKRGRNMNQK